MKQYILIMLLALAGLAGMAQTNEPLPGDAEPLTNQLYLSPSDSTVWAADPFSGLAIKVGTWFKVDSLFKEGYTKVQVDSAIAALTLPATKPGYRFTVIPNVDEDEDVVGATGLSYKEDSREYVISYYSYDKESKLWIYGRNSDNLTPYSPIGALAPEPDREINVSDYIDYIQGNVWDADSACYWIVGTKKGGPNSDNNRVLIAVDDSGALISTHSLTGSIEAQMGQIAVKEDVLMIKPNGDSTLYFLNKDTKALIRTEHTDARYEGLAYDHKRDLIWVVDDYSKIFVYDYDSFIPVYRDTFETLPDGVRQNVEGVMIDPVDDKLIMAFDGYLHGSNNNGNALFKFDIPRYTVRLPKRLSETTFETDTGIASGSHRVITVLSNNGLNNNVITSIDARGSLAGRTYSSDKTQHGGYAVEYSRDQLSPRIRFLATDSSGTTLGNVVISPKEEINGFRMLYLSSAAAGNDGVNHFDFDFLSGVATALSSSPPNIESKGGKALVTKEWVNSYGLGSGSTTDDWDATNGSRFIQSNTNAPAAFAAGISVATGRMQLAGRADNFYVRDRNEGTGWKEIYHSGIPVITTGQFRLSALNTPPASATATGTAGEIRFGTDGRIYICTATNTWIRSEPLTTW